METINKVSGYEIRVAMINNPNLTNDEIAKTFGITERVVKQHRGIIIRNNGSAGQSPEDKKKAQEMYNKKYFDKKRAENTNVKETKTKPSIKEVLGAETAEIPFLQSNKIEDLKKEASKIVNKHLPSTDTYENEKGKFKEIARAKMANYIIESGVDGVIPTLPHIKCKIETKILQNISDVHFIGVNNVRATFEENEEFIKLNNLPMIPHFGNMSDLIYGKKENSYGHMILDYCCQISTVSDELEYALKHNLVKKNGYILLTVSKPLRADDKKSKKLKAFGERLTNNPNDTRCISDTAIEGYIYSILGKRYKFVEVFHYNDTYPMCLLVLKRIK